jgi:diaminobutyrate-2-oxoglutarate transaminase
MAAGTATIRYVMENDLTTHARKLGEQIRTGFEEAAHALPAIGEVRGRGLMLGVELVEPDGAPDALGARPAAPELAHAVRAAALSRGVLVELGGRHGSVLRLLPPLTVTDLEAEQVVSALIDSIAEASGLAGAQRARAGARS